MSVDTLVGDTREGLALLPDRSVRCCVTSPPYWGLRDYGVAGQLGLEATPAEYVAAMVGVFAEVRRVLADDGTLWLNLGDSYARQGGKTEGVSRHWDGREADPGGQHQTRHVDNLAGLFKPKDLIGIPWRVAFALQADGWYLRSDIIWAKPNPMPESVTDRPTKAHEYVFLLSKSERYFYDADAIAEPVTESSLARVSQPTLAEQKGSDRVPGKTNGAMKAVVRKQDEVGNRQYTGFNDRYSASEKSATRNSRTVWSITTQPFKGAHFATFPPALAERCILAGSAAGDTVLDPFGGSGTTGAVADYHGRNAILLELNPTYAAMVPARIADVKTKLDRARAKTK